jgi:TrmH family RNA methyltransferase
MRSDYVITSRDNALARRARRARDGKLPNLICIEGLRLCEEAQRAALIIEDLIVTEKLLRDQRGANLYQELLRNKAVRITLFSESVFASISDTKTPQGIIALARRPQTTDEHVLESSSAEVSPLIVILNRVNNPSNAGAILRTAEAAGATSVIATLGTTDLFSPKALRGAMGSSFRLPIWDKASFAEALSWCAARGINTIGTDLGSRKAHTEINWCKGCALVVGAEASGLPDVELARVDETIAIPMRAPVESLNVAVAAAIILYEAARQRVSAR